MPIADILLRVVPTAEGELERLAVAIDLAQRLHARLAGVFVSGPEGDKAEWAESLFNRALSRSPLETTWRVLEGDPGLALIFQARRSDLAILPGAQSAPDACAPERVAIGSGRPVLILPGAAKAISIGHRVLVCWNETSRSARAIHEAMPILLNADEVHVLTVVAQGDLEPLGDRRLLDHLRQHGVLAKGVRRHGEAADRIAAEVRDQDIDMVVIGLRARAEDLPSSLGKVSRRFVRTAALPVFLSH